MHSYIWFPPVKFLDPIVINGVSYKYLTGAMSMYGNTFDNIVVGGLVADSGKVASWSGGTPMRDIARQWFDSTSERNVGVGGKTLTHGNFEWTLAIAESTYLLEISQQRGKAHGLWEHAFMVNDGGFEIHEALTRWSFKLKKAGGSHVIQETSAVGLLEFGKNLIGYDDSS